MKKTLLILSSLSIITSLAIAECTINPITGVEVCSGTTSPTPTPTPEKAEIDGSSENIVENSDGSATIKFEETLDNDIKVTIDSTIESDNSGKTVIDLSKDSLEKSSSVEFEKDTKIEVDSDGNIKHTLSSDTSTIDVTSLKSGKVDIKISTVSGKSIAFNSPVGVEVKATKEQLTQSFTTQSGLNANLILKNDGTLNLDITAKNGESIKFESNIDIVTNLREDGKLQQSFDLEDLTSEIVSTKRAELKASFGEGESKREFILKGAELTIEKSQVVAKKSENGYSSTITTTKDDMSVEVSTEQRANDRITYSVRREAINPKIDLVYPNRSSLRRVENGFIRAIYSYRRDISFSNSNLRAVDTNYNITPINDIKLQERKYFDNSSDIKLLSGKVNFQTTISNENRNIEINVEKANKFTINSSGFRVSNEFNNTKTDIIANSDGGVRIAMRQKGKNKKFSYSPRADIANLKIDFVNANERRIDSDRLKVAYSPRREITFELENESVTLYPNDNAVIEENINLDGTRVVVLTEGDANISYGSGEAQSMTSNAGYEIPALAQEPDETYIATEQSIDLNLKIGWNLVASPISSDITDMFTFGEFETIWTFVNNSWIENPNRIDYQSGIWIYMNEDKTINFSGSSYQANLDSLDSGWSLVGLGDNLSDDEKYQIESIWTYRDNEFIESNLSNLNIGEGFWVKRANTDLKLNITTGWNLLGTPTDENLTNLEKLGDYNSLSIFEENEWITPTQITPNIGFWLNSNINRTIAFYGNSYEANLSSIEQNWSLLSGVLNSIQDLDFSDIWSYKNGNWSSKSSGELQNIESGYGFWLKK